MPKITISKINNLKNIESFLQINLFKGYKYVDKAGEIVNNFYHNKKEPIFKMGLGGLIISQPNEEVEEVKISAKTFWSHFVNPSSFESSINYFEKISIETLNILEVDKISRLGWRNYFVYEFPNEEKRDEILNRFFVNKNFKMEEFNFSTKDKELSLDIKVKKIKKNDEMETPGLLFDIDISQSFDDFLEKKELPAKLLEFINFIRSNTFLNIINTILRDKTI